MQTDTAADTFLIPFLKKSKVQTNLNNVFKPMCIPNYVTKHFNNDVFLKDIVNVFSSVHKLRISRNELIYYM